MRTNIQMGANNILTKSLKVSLLLVLFLLPLIVKAQSTPLSRTPGSPAGSYPLSGFDTVNLFNGNLNFNLPILNVGGRGEVSNTIPLNIETQWGYSETQPTDGIFMQEYTTYDSNPSYIGSIYGYTLPVATGQFCEEGSSAIYIWHYGITYTSPDGTEHNLIDRVLHGREHNDCLGGGNINLGSIFESTDGAFITFVSDTDIYVKGQGANGNGYLYFRNGTKSRIEGWRIVWTEDRNGNKTEYTYAGYSPKLSKIKDSLGREVTFDYHVTESAPYGVCNKITYKGFNNETRVIRISIDTLSNALRTTQMGDSSSVKTYQQLFWNGQSNYYISNANSYYNPEVVTKLWLPDGIRSYQFKYNVYRQLARVELPTGGAFEYDFVPQNGVDNRVKEKRTYNDNSLVNTTKFSVGVDAIEVEQFDSGSNRLSKAKHFFHSTAFQTPVTYAPWNAGREYKTEIYDADGTTLLRRVEKDWKQRFPSWWGSHNPGTPETAPTNNPFVVETRETLADGNLVSKTTAVNPTTGEWAFDAYNNQIDSWTYDYGNGQPGQFLRRTHTDYVTATNYTGADMPSLPSQTWVSSDSAGNNKASLVQYEYDNYSGANHASLVSRTNVIGHNATNYGSTYTRRGNVTAVTSYENAQYQTGAITVYSQYDILGNVVKTIDAKGYVSTINYNDNFGSPDGDARNNSAPGQLNSLNAFAFATSETNPLGWTSYSQFDYFTGKAVNTEDINGVISKMSYNDPLGRLKQSVEAVGNTGHEIQTTINYYDEDHRIEVTSDLYSLNDNLIKSESFYDDFARTTESRSYKDGDYVAVITQYDDFGRVKQVTNPYRPLRSEQVLWTQSKYDALGRTKEVKTLDDGAKILTSYYGNIVTVTDQAGKQKRSVTNALGELKRVDEPNSSGQLDVSGTPTQPTNYTYDVLGNLTQVQQTGTTTQQCGGTVSTCSQTRSFSYDSLSRLKSATNPESGTVNYTYDNNGNLLTKTDARQITTTNVFDELNRVKTRTYSDTTKPVSYYYDGVYYDAQNQIQQATGSVKGKVTSVSSDVSRTNYTSFDITGKVKQSRQITDGVAYNPMSYVYNLSGELIEETYPSGRVVRNILDNDGDLSRVQSKKNVNSGFWNYAQNFTYTASGAASSMQLGNGRWESTLFNERLQPKQIALGTTQNATNLLKLEYSYGTTNNNGNIQSQTITVPTIGTNQGFTAIQTYNYDSLNRIQDVTETISSNQTWKQTFTYDRYGNRSFNEGSSGGNYLTTTLTRGCSTSTYNPNGICNKKNTNPIFASSTNKIVQDQDNDSVNDYLLGASGNTTKDANDNTYIYDADNKQIEAKNSSNQSIGQYWYDGDGKRVKKKGLVNGQWEETVFIYDASRMLVAEYSNVVETTNPKVNYLTTDILGTPRINTDQNGTVTARHDYQPFGEEISRTSYGVDTVKKKFTGYERDKETDLDFAQARMYSSKLGRFMSPDYNENSFVSEMPNPVPYAFLSNPQTLNQYSYLNNNPLNAIDSTGHGGKKFPVPGTSGRYWYRLDPINDQDYINVHIFDKQGNEVGRMAIKGTSGQRAYEWAEYGSGVPNKIRAKMENLSVEKGWSVKPPINASDPNLTGRTSTGAVEENAPRSINEEGGIRGGRGGTTFNSFAAAIAYLSLFSQLYAQQQDGARLGYYYDMHNTVMIVDINKAVENLPQNQLYQVGPNIYKIEDHKFVDILKKGCVLTQNSNGNLGTVCTT